VAAVEATDPLPVVVTMAWAVLGVVAGVCCIMIVDDGAPLLLMSLWRECQPFMWDRGGLLSLWRR